MERKKENIETAYIIIPHATKNFSGIKNIVLKNVIYR